MRHPNGIFKAFFAGRLSIASGRCKRDDRIDRSSTALPSSLRRIDQITDIPSEPVERGRSFSCRIHIEYPGEFSLMNRLSIRQSGRHPLFQPSFGIANRFGVFHRSKIFFDPFFSYKGFGRGQKPCFIFHLRQDNANILIAARADIALRRKISACSTGQSSSASNKTRIPPLLSFPIIPAASAIAFSISPFWNIFVLAIRIGLGVFNNNPGYSSCAIRRKSSGTAATSPCPSTILTIV